MLGQVPFSVLTLTQYTLVSDVSFLYFNLLFPLICSCITVGRVGTRVYMWVGEVAW